MKFSELVALIDSLNLGEPGQPRRPPRDNVRAVQNALAAGLADSDFRLDLVELALEDFEQTRGVPRDDAPWAFLRLPSRGISFRLIFWWPRREAGPHEHSSWTVTAVVHNALDVQTYDYAMARDMGKIVPKNLFSAKAGAAGHIHEPCIHNPFNPTRDWSASIHIFNDDDRPTIPGIRGPREADAPMTEADAAFHLANRYRVLLQMLSGLPSRRALHLMDRIHALGDEATKQLATQAMMDIDAEYGAKRACELQPLAPLSIFSRLAHARRNGTLSVRVEGSQAEMILSRGNVHRMLISVDAWAKEALEFVAERDVLEVRELPEPLDNQDRLALCEALIEMGVLRRDC